MKKVTREVKNFNQSDIIIAIKPLFLNNKIKTLKFLNIVLAVSIRDLG